MNGFDETGLWPGFDEVFSHHDSIFLSIKTYSVSMTYSVLIDIKWPSRIHIYVYIYIEGREMHKISYIYVYKTV